MSLSRWALALVLLHATAQGAANDPATARRGGPPDPFADEKPLYTISAKNVDQYLDVLSEGQVALLRKYPEHRFDVYPSHRSFAAPEWLYAATRVNATRAKLSNGGDKLEGAARGVPFPIPTTGQEIMWNHRLAWRGDGWRRQIAQIITTASGAYTVVRIREQVLDAYYQPNYRGEPVYQYFMQETLSPPRYAGQVLLVHETIDQVAQPRQAWTYQPGQRRVRRAPNVAYDNPGTASDGLRTSDQLYMFNGALDRYDWTLIGKREAIVPYNAFRLSSGALNYADLIRPGHLAPEHLRYERHRVWVVEGKLKADRRHLYARRRFYIDEDSWHILVADHYDGRDRLWRVAEAHLLLYPDGPILRLGPEVVHDLISGRYLVVGLSNEEPPFERASDLKPADFTPQALRQAGVR